MTIIESGEYSAEMIRKKHRSIANAIGGMRKFGTVYRYSRGIVATCGHAGHHFQVSHGVCLAEKLHHIPYSAIIECYCAVGFYACTRLRSSAHHYFLQRGMVSERIAFGGKSCYRKNS